MDVMQMEAGAELDRLVAEKVFGLEDIFTDQWGQYCYRQEGVPGHFPITDSSESLTSAWLIVEHLHFVGLRHYKASGVWEATFLAGDTLREYPVTASADTAPLAICRAALMAVAGKDS